MLLLACLLGVLGVLLACLWCSFRFTLHTQDERRRQGCNPQADQEPAPRCQAKESSCSQQADGASLGWQGSYILGAGDAGVEETQEQTYVNTLLVLHPSCLFLFTRFCVHVLCFFVYTILFTRSLLFFTAHIYGTGGAWIHNPATRSATSTSDAVDGNETPTPIMLCQAAFGFLDYVDRTAGGSGAPDHLSHHIRQIVSSLCVRSEETGMQFTNVMCAAKWIVDNKTKPTQKTNKRDIRAHNHYTFSLVYVVLYSIWGQWCDLSILSDDVIEPIAHNLCSVLRCIRTMTRCTGKLKSGVSATRGVDHVKE